MREGSAFHCGELVSIFQETPLRGYQDFQETMEEKEGKQFPESMEVIDHIRNKTQRLIRNYQLKLEIQ